MSCASVKQLNHFRSRRLTIGSISTKGLFAMSCTFCRIRIVVVVAASILFLNQRLHAKDVYVNNVAGDDHNTGQLERSASPGSGPTKSIQRALRLADAGDRIVIANTGQAYYECVTVQGDENSGSKSFPFIIEGNGAVIDGTAAVPEGEWRPVAETKTIFALEPDRYQHQQLFLDGKPLAQDVSILSQYQLGLLKPEHWTYLHRCLILRTANDKLPRDYNLSYSAHPVGVTLYRVRHVVVRNLTVQGFQLDGVNAHDNAFDCRLEDVRLRGNGRSGLSVGGASRIELAGSTLGDNGVAQIRTEGWSTTKVIRSELLVTRSPAWSIEGGRLYVDGELKSPAFVHANSRSPLHRK